MYRILFVCLGNICRSPMAECVMADMIKKCGLSGKIEVASAATSSEEEGNPIYPPAQRKLREMGVPVLNHTATRLRRADYAEYDLILGMEKGNVQNILRIVGGDCEGKVKRLLDFSDNPRDIADPWWTGDFDRAYEDIREGCERLIDYLISVKGL